jgi:hypothetical protein
VSQLRVVRHISPGRRLGYQNHSTTYCDLPRAPSRLLNSLNVAHLRSLCSRHCSL